MRDVNLLRSQKGWPRMMALQYYINLGAKSRCDNVSGNLKKAYEAARKGRFL